MKKIYKKTIFFIFVFLFFVSTPLILLYTAGYRYNPLKGSLERTGSLILDSLTKNVNLYINDKFQKNETEIIVKNILPGEYNIKITKDDYLDWQKKLYIESRLTTFIKDIRLFQKPIPEKIITGDILSFQSSFDKKKIAYIEKINDKYTLKIHKNNETKIIFEDTLPIEHISWSSDDSKIIINQKNKHSIIDEKGKAIDLPIFNIETLVWDEKNSLVVYAKNNNGFYKLDLLLNTQNFIYRHQNKVANFAVYNESLYFIDDFELKQISLTEEKTISIPLERNNYKINRVSNGRIFILNPNHQFQIFNLPLTEKTFPIFIAEAKDFDEYDNNLVFYNDFEIWSYNFGDNKKELITRISQVINKVFWLNNLNNLIYTTDKEMKIMEMDKRDKRNIYNLITDGEIGDFFLNKNYEIYFINQKNDARGVIRLEI